MVTDQTKKRSTGSMERLSESKKARESERKRERKPDHISTSGARRQDFPDCLLTPCLFLSSNLIIWTEDRAMNRGTSSAGEKWASHTRPPALCLALGALLSLISARLSSSADTKPIPLSRQPMAMHIIWSVHSKRSRGMRQLRFDTSWPHSPPQTAARIHYFSAPILRTSDVMLEAVAFGKWQIKKDEKEFKAMLGSIMYGLGSTQATD
eukprot:855635-Rhodomonas_salina.2